MNGMTRYDRAAEFARDTGYEPDAYAQGHEDARRGAAKQLEALLAHWGEEVPAAQIRELITKLREA